MTNDEKSKTVALLPCPFCGNEPTQFAATEPSGYVRGHSITCDTCGFSLGDEYQDEVAACWNQRPPLSPSEQSGKEAVPVAYVEAIEGERPIFHSRGSSVYAHIRNFSHLHDPVTVTPVYAHPPVSPPPLLDAEREDAARYRWLRNERHNGTFNNRWPAVTQYPYQPNIDSEMVPQIERHIPGKPFREYRGEYLDEAVDAGRLRSTTKTEGE